MPEQDQAHRHVAIRDRPSHGAMARRITSCAGSI